MRTINFILEKLPLSTYINEKNKNKNIHPKKMRKKFTHTFALDSNFE